MPILKRFRFSKSIAVVSYLTAVASLSYSYPVRVTPVAAVSDDPLSNIDHIIVIYQENWSFDALYGNFPGANGRSSASAASLTQIDRLNGNALSSEPGNTYNNPAFVPGNPTAQVDQIKNPPVPLTSDSSTAVADSRFPANLNTLQPFALSTYIDPTALTGDLYHRYWQEQYQVAGSYFANSALNSGTDGSNDRAAGNNSGLVTWGDNPGLVLSYFDATNLPEGVLAQQYTICDNFSHSAFGGSFLNHQFLIAGKAPVYTSMPTSNNGNIAYLDPNGLFVMNTGGPATGKYVRDGSVTPVAGDQISVTLNGAPQAITLTATNTRAYSGPSAINFDKHYVVNTTRSVNLAGNGENGSPGNGNSPLVSLLPSLNNSNPTHANSDARPYVQTIGDLLSTNNVSWKWYSGGWNYIVAYSGSNPNPTTSPSYGSINAQQQLQYHHQPLAYFDNYAPFDTLNIVPSSMVGGFAGTGTGGLTPGQMITRAQNSAAHIQDEANFFTDVQNNTLPSVVFIKPVGVNNEHPGYAALQMGQDHVSSIVQAVQSNPSLWAHTAIIVTYDEHGGRWDHVTPPVRDIWGPGQRVPCLVISPYAKKGFINHDALDTSSILSTIEQRFTPGQTLAEDASNASDANAHHLDANATSLASVFTNLNIARSSYTVNRRTNRLTQNVTVTNLGSTNIDSPVQLVLDNLSSNTTLTNANGVTANNPPLGSPYITIASSLSAGASATVTLQFTIPASGGVTYNARTVVGNNP